MGLPYDVARCSGTTLEVCQVCSRREPGDAVAQWYVAAEVDTVSGECCNFIEPTKTKNE